ncbi:DUF3263 domain-containing protein [Gordonia westfalica]|nr:DUF3263 domain-containing protein [Gordonia westfalica]
MLDLAGRRWNYAGNLEQKVRDEFGISLTRFWQIVNRLLDTQEALSYSPQKIHTVQTFDCSPLLRRVVVKRAAAARAMARFMGSLRTFTTCGE